MATMRLLRRKLEATVMIAMGSLACLGTSHGLCAIQCHSAKIDIVSTVAIQTPLPSWVINCLATSPEARQKYTQKPATPISPCAGMGRASQPAPLQASSILCPTQCSCECAHAVQLLRESLNLQPEYRSQSVLYDDVLLVRMISGYD
jgi:hypothetical protein